MEPLNKIQLRGVIEDVKTTVFGNLNLYNIRIIVATPFTSMDGDNVVNMQRFNVRYFSSSDESALLSRGNSIEVNGRLDSVSYVDSSGENRTYIDIRAQEIKSC